MKLEDKVPSFELCEKLWDLGITKQIETERMCFKIFDRGHDKWLPPDVGYRHNVIAGKKLYRSGYLFFPAPDLSEMGELLPYRLKVNVIAEQQRTYYLYSQKEYDGWNCFYAMNNGQTRLWIKDAPTEPNARAEMLIALKEEGDLSVTAHAIA